jgi:hypothetical protein
MVPCLSVVALKTTGVEGTPGTENASYPGIWHCGRHTGILQLPALQYLELMTTMTLGSRQYKEYPNVAYASARSDIRNVEATHPTKEVGGIVAVAGASNHLQAAARRMRLLSMVVG